MDLLVISAIDVVAGLVAVVISCNFSPIMHTQQFSILKIYIFFVDDIFARSWLLVQINYLCAYVEVHVTLITTAVLGLTEGGQFIAISFTWEHM